MPRRGPKPRVGVLLAFALVAAVAAVALLFGGNSSAPSSPSVPIPAVHAEDFQRSTVYRPRRAPGYTAWVGAWSMPDGDLMTAFTQAAGEPDPGRRANAPESLLATYGRDRGDADRDFWGLRLTARYLRSGDGGETWRQVRADPFRALYPQGYSGAAVIALEDGTILRRVNGDDLRHDPDVPHTAFIQRLRPGGGKWEGRQVLLDPRRFTYQIARFRRLPDGRLIATGNYWETPASTTPARRSRVRNRHLLMVSGDGGRTWKRGLTIARGTVEPAANEWDTAPLPNGDLVAVMRTVESPERPVPARKQALLRKNGNGWEMTRVAAAPFPHSGQPELLTTLEGPVLHLATTGAHYTRNGIDWTRLRFVPREAYRTNYYPRAVQTEDGVVHVFAHAGADDPFGRRDQAITMDTFRIAPGR